KRVADLSKTVVGLTTDYTDVTDSGSGETKGASDTSTSEVTEAPTARKSIAQVVAKQSPGSIVVQRDAAPQGRHKADARVEIVSPFQGWSPSATPTQGVALGYRLARRWRFGCGFVALGYPWFQLFLAGSLLRLALRSY